MQHVLLRAQVVAKCATDATLTVSERLSQAVRRVLSAPLTWFNPRAARVLCSRLPAWRQDQRHR